MITAQTKFFLVLFVVTLFGALGTSSSAQAAMDDPLREEALALNDVTGENPIRGEIKALINNPKHTKQLLATAMKMAKEKEQPFSYNGRTHSGAKLRSS